MLLELQERLEIVRVALAAQSVQHDLIFVRKVVEDEELNHVFGVSQNPREKNAGVVDAQELLHDFEQFLVLFAQLAVVDAVDH